MEVDIEWILYTIIFVSHVLDTKNIQVPIGNLDTM